MNPCRLVLATSIVSPALFDSADHVLLVSSTPLTATVFLPPFLQGSLISKGRDLMETSSLDYLSVQCLTVGLCTHSHWLPEEAFLIKTVQGTHP